MCQKVFPNLCQDFFRFTYTGGAQASERFACPHVLEHPIYKTVLFIGGLFYNISFELFVTGRVHMIRNFEGASWESRLRLVAFIDVLMARARTLSDPTKSLRQWPSNLGQVRVLQ